MKFRKIDDSPESYWVFLRRLSAEDFAPARNPIDAVRGRPPADP